MSSKLKPAIWSCDTGHIGIHGRVDIHMVVQWPIQIFLHRWVTIFSYTWSSTIIIVININIITTTTNPFPHDWWTIFLVKSSDVCIKWGLKWYFRLKWMLMLVSKYWAEPGRRAWLPIMWLPYLAPSSFFLPYEPSCFEISKAQLVLLFPLSILMPPSPFFSLVLAYFTSEHIGTFPAPRLRQVASIVFYCTPKH